MALVDMHVDMAERAAGEVGRQARYASGGTPRRGDAVRPAGWGPYGPAMEVAGFACPGSLIVRDPAGGYGVLPASELDPVGGAL